MTTKKRIKQAIKDLSWISANMSLAKMPDEAGKLIDAAVLIDDMANMPMNGIPTQRFLDILWSYEELVGPIFHDLDRAFRLNKTRGEMQDDDAKSIP